MPQVDLCFSPELLHLHKPQGKIVVIVDILRATTTMCSALYEGVTAIKPFAELEACQAAKSEGYLIAGERGGTQVEGFDLGNSPRAFFKRTYQGEKLAMTTTNGTIALEKVKDDAEEILIGAFSNISQLSDYLLQESQDTLILCAGWKGKFNLEDSLFGGALINRMIMDFGMEEDAALAAQALYLSYKDNLGQLMAQASHSKRLQNHDLEADQEFCFQEDSTPILPYFNGVEIVLK